MKKNKKVINNGKKMNFFYNINTKTINYFYKEKKTRGLFFFVMLRLLKDNVICQKLKKPKFLGDQSSEAIILTDFHNCLCNHLLYIY